MTTQLAAGPPTDRAAFQLADWALFCAVGLIWGSSFLLIKIGLDTLDPGLITWARIALGALILQVIRRNGPPVDRAHWSRIVVLSIVWVAVPFTLYPIAEQHINSAVTGLLTGATPFFAGIFGAAFFHRTPGTAQKLAMAVGFAGVALISAGSSAEGGTAVLGVVLVLVATACYGYAANLAAPLQHRYGSVSLMANMLALAAVWTLPLGLAGLPHSQLTVRPVVATGMLGVVGTGIAFALMATLVGRVGAPRASFMTYLIPLVALALGAALLSEKVTALALVGAGLVLLAAFLASRPEP